MTEMTEINTEKLSVALYKILSENGMEQDIPQDVQS